jgi:hypothetical protein
MIIHAIEVPRAIVIQIATWYKDEFILETTCRDYDHYVSLPNVVTCDGVECGKTGWNSDRCQAYYKSTAIVAHSK